MVSKYLQGFSSCHSNETMYVSGLTGYDSLWRTFTQASDGRWRTCCTMFTSTPFKPILSLRLAGCSSHTSTLIPPTLQRSWKGSYITCTLMALPLPWALSGRMFGVAPSPPPPQVPLPAILPTLHPLSPKHQFIKVIHVEVAKEYEGIAADLVHKALHNTTFRHTTNLMMLVPIYSA